ncbi:MAG: CheR family methyltransferase [Alphaproteobacteria bacterium]|jgi:two-component system CheB/CheR fusion protein
MDEVSAEAPPMVEQDDERMFWIGIGASAGGLEALRELVSTLPKHATMPATYIVAQHLSPKHQSMLVQLVGRDTVLSVRELENGTIPEPNVMYVTPPNSDVFAEDGVLYLRQPISQISPKPSVDNFFTSLAESVGDHAIGIILSGTGSDGAHGVRAIRAVGGITIAQEPTDAKYNGMPKSAIETGCVDFVLPLKDINNELFKAMRTPNHLRRLKGDDIQRTNIQELLYLIKERNNVDFKDYKTGTLYRRINRRMAACNVYNLNEYLEYIHNTPEELDILFKDIMISVTNFFRDADCFNAIKEVIQDIVNTKSSNDSIRVWIPGCATGEEAYSIAILFAEACGGIAPMNKKFRLQIFATDIDTDALARARKGIYPEATLANVEVALREHYFRTRDNAYEITKPLRDLVVFSRHNVFEDPPFLRMDLIACRNLLIYFNTKLQHSVLSLFHYAMQPEGIMFLGKSESLGHSANLFQTLDSKHRLYKRKLVSSGDYSKQSRASYATTTSLKKLEIPGLQSTNKSIHDLPDAFIEALSPDSILIDENMDIIRVYGDVHAYTQLSPGGVTMNLLSLARKEFRQELRALVFKIIREQKTYTVLPKKIALEGKLHEIHIIIRLLHLKNSSERLILVSFEKIKQLSEDSTTKLRETQNGTYVRELEQELASTKEHLQTVVEELETSNEELQSTNEELQSSNEELQSSNEELETANEELQSTNEELLTVNEELQVKTAELASTNEDLNNIKESIDYPILVVNKELKTKRFNRASKDIFALTDESQGEALTNIVTRIEIPHLKHHVENVIQENKPHMRQLDFEDVSYLERITPYKNEGGRVEGAILTYVNNTSERKIQAKLQESEDRFRLAIAGSSSGIWDLYIRSGRMYCFPHNV